MKLKLFVMTLILCLVSILSFGQDNVMTKKDIYHNINIEYFNNDTIIFSKHEKIITMNLKDVLKITIDEINTSNSNFIIKEISKDSIFFVGGTKLSSNIFHESQSFNDKFVDFYFKNPSSSNEFKYILYSLEKYRYQNNAGKWTMFIGGWGIVGIGALTLSPPIMVVGGIVSIVGFIIEWNSLKHLRINNIPQKIDNKYIIRK